ncbi:CU044_5270 family protein [Streptomyces sp. BE303]|uniref:CU044_5270 family protein n=1 Tax=Streptomyces sp. BE303 TaxID=3002528 RepID=UPI002E78CAF0|nr:CU044_5270 family protein [Streptomyces sp. BE303]MED7950298.1 CU044_5270 family protein [Streptomyces sp. BE303]
MTSVPERQQPLDDTELRHLLPAAETPAVQPDRQRQIEEFLMSEITRTPEAAGPARPESRNRRRLLIALPATLAAFALAATVAVTTFGNPDTAPVRGDRVPASVVQVTAGDTAGLAGAVERISLAAQSTPDLVLRPGQYVYVESTVSYLMGSLNADTGEEKTWVDKPHQRQIWRSADGRTGWLTEEGKTAQGGEALKSDTAARLRYPSYDYLNTLPTDPQVLLQKIYTETAGGGNNGPDQEAFDTVLAMVREQAVPGKLAAALYQAAARIPGVVLVDNATDAAGRAGIAIARTNTTTGSRDEMIFDRTSYTFLGERGVQVTEAFGVKPGTVTANTAVLKRVATDAPGRPPGTGKA